MKKQILLILLTSFIFVNHANSQSMSLDDAINSVEQNRQKEEDNQSEKAKNFMMKTINSSKDENEKILVTLLSYLTFQHKFLNGYPNYCEKQGMNINRFKDIYKQANSEIIKKVDNITARSKDIKPYLNNLFENKIFLDTEYKSIDEEFSKVAMMGFSKSEMCEIFNSKSKDDIDINYSNTFKDLSYTIMTYDENKPIIIK
ncbi:MAG: hypothetical protein BWY78_01479 [Alphaproteobacteria bacterium ADurb.Bin438]|nr:MAG: hypothetical protein BWY78_01479 [Alphaproteobacteria bacterium ADurb.Bin438]